MRQVWIPKPGPPEVLEVREAPDPDPGAGEVRIRVSAAGVNFADISARLGTYQDCPPMLDRLAARRGEGQTQGLPASSHSVHIAHTARKAR